MKKGVIKVIKRNEKNGTEKIRVVIAAKVERDIQLKIVNKVNNWISERGENSRVEKLFSDNKISAWKIMSEKV